MKNTISLKRSGFKQKKTVPLKRTAFTKKTPSVRAQNALGRAKGTKRIKTIKKKPKTVTQAKLKKQLDSVFSQYIRMKFPERCYTCGVQKPRKELQCGHFVSRQYLATRFDENNCRPQCVGCNMFGKGKPLDFEENLKKELGSDFVEAMKLKRHLTVKLDRQWYLNRIEEYTILLNSL